MNDLLKIKIIKKLRTYRHVETRNEEEVKCKSSFTRSRCPHLTIFLADNFFQLILKLILNEVWNAIKKKVFI